jgi:hypothetical protein
LAAHGKFPAANAVFFDPNSSSDPNSKRHVVVRTTFGFLDSAERKNSHSEGASPSTSSSTNWRWLCSSAIGYDADKEDPAVAFASSTLLVGAFSGLVRGASMCDFAPVGGELADRYFVDLATIPNGSNGRALALSSNGKADDVFEVRLFESADTGKSWTAFGTPLPVDFLALSLEVGAKDGDWARVYVSGRDGNKNAGYHGVVFRSDDRGMTWQRLVIAEVDGVGTLPYLQAVDAQDPDRVYLAGILEAPPNSQQTNYSSKDGAKTWSKYTDKPELLKGFALSPDGKRAVFGGDKSRLWLLDTDKLTSTQVSMVRVGCASWQTDGLYVCANDYADGFAVGVSQDEGKTFKPFVRLTSACGPLECELTSSVGKTCPALWPKEAAELVAPKTCNPAAPPPPPAVSSDCSCRAGAASRDDSRLWLLTLCLLTVWRRHHHSSRRFFA